MSVNKVILVGRLGQNPELRYTNTGMPVCSFSLATSESWKDRNSGQKQEKTEWHRIVVWSKLAEFCNQYLAKGRQIFLEGKLRTRSWDDKDGTKRYTTEIMADSIQFIGPAAGASAGAGNGVNAGAPSEDMGMADGIPFEDFGAAAKSAPVYNSRDKGHNLPVEDNFAVDDLPF